MKKKLCCFSFILMSFITSISWAQNIKAHKKLISRWIPVSHMLAPRSNVAAVAHGNMVYIIGGNDYSGGTNSVWRFNLHTKRWQKLPSMFHDRFAHSAIFYHDKIYVFGGMQKISGRDYYLRSAEVFNLHTMRWRRLSFMPIPRARFALTQYQGKFYLIGGINNKHQALRSVAIFNPRTGLWSSGAPLPSGRNRLEAVTLQGQLYVLGGADQYRNALKSVLLFSAKHKTWHEVAAMDVARKNFAATVMNNKIYVAGGWRCKYGHEVFVSSTEEINPKTKHCKVIAKLPYGRDGVKAIAEHNSLYLFGGYHNKIEDSVLELKNFAAS